jgi:hypothetical protein
MYVVFESIKSVVMDVVNAMDLLANLEDHSISESLSMFHAAQDSQEKLLEDAHQNLWDAYGGGIIHNAKLEQPEALGSMQSYYGSMAPPTAGPPAPGASFFGTKS